MYLKIMGDDDAGDDDTRKTFRLLQQVVAVNFDRMGDLAFAQCTFEDDSFEQFEIPGNAYIMNDQGKTIGKFGSHPIPPEPVPFALDGEQNIA